MLTPGQQHAAFQRGMTLLEAKLLRRAGAARNAFIRRAAKEAEKSGLVPTHLVEEHRSRIRATLQAHYEQTARYFAMLALSGIRRGRKSALTPLEALIFEWVRREALRKATLISDTDRDDIAAVIEAGMAEGLGTREIATAIRKLTGQTPYKAALIARTETHAAATYGSIESVRDAEISLGMTLLKQWVPTRDLRTRPEHLAMAGKPPIPLNEKFIVGGEAMDRPGDPAGSAGNTVACRCSLVFEEVE